MKPSLLVLLSILMSGALGSSWGGSSLTFKNGDAAGDPFTAPTVTKGLINQQLGRFKFTLGNNDSLIATSIFTSGTRTGLTNFKLWFSADNAFDIGTDTLLKTIGTDPGDGGTLAFSTFSQAVVSGTPYWCFVTADVASNATGTIRTSVGLSPLIFNTVGAINITGSEGNLSTADIPVPVVLSHFTTE